MNKPLGKGLQALIDTYSDPENDTINEGIEIAKISPNPLQPRQIFNDEAMQDMINSVRELGVLQPITVRKRGEDTFELIAGERRFRAAKQAGLKKVPAYVLEVDNDEDLLEMALVENIQREDLNPLEEAEGYLVLLEKYNLTHQDVAKRVGKSREVITNRTRLLKLPLEIRQAIKNGLLSKKHGELLAGLETSGQMIGLFQRIQRDGLSVRQTETLIRKLKELRNTVSPSKKKSNVKKSSLIRFESELCTSLGTKVTIDSKKGNKGKIVIQYFSDEDFERLYEILTEKNS